MKRDIKSSPLYQAIGRKLSVIAELYPDIFKGTGAYEKYSKSNKKL
jgi:hypothetical protein